jgi:hypothetical protein
VYVNTPLEMQPTSLQQWNLSVQRELGGWLVAASYLGSHSSHLWRVLELNPAVFGPGATTGNTNQRRVLFRQNPDQGRFYGTIAQLDDTGRANYHAAFLQVQRRLKNNLSVLSNYTLSKCEADPATTEITGPTVVDPNNPDLDYSYCAADRRHIVNLSVVWTTPRMGNGLLGTLFSDWQISPLVRWQTGSRSSVTTGVDNALNGTPPAPANFGGGQRAVQVLEDPYGDGTPNNYLNRAAFTSPAPGTYSTLPPFSIVNPSSLQNDIAVSRNFKVGGNQSLQFRWEIFNVLNHANFNGPVTALNSPSFGRIQSAGDPRIMQFALKFRFN